MSNLGIFILAHHKPWLMMGSIISLAMQTEKDFDLNIIYIKGDGNCKQNQNYKKFNEIQKKSKERNYQLTIDDERIIEVLKNTNFRIKFYEFENDHGLDTGAWYKLIRRKYWEKYEHSLMLMEGFLFTGINSLSSLKRFAKRKDCDFVDMGFEKRCISKKRVLEMNLRGNNTSDMEAYHQQIINDTFKFFCIDKDFKKIYDDWVNCPGAKLEDISTFNYVTRKIFSFLDILRLGLFNLRRYRNINVFSKRFVLENPIGFCHKPRELFKEISIQGTNFHEEKSPHYFGCMCQHLFSNRFLQSLTKKYDEYNFWSAAEQPFSASPLELIWGVMPKWLGYKKWFFDGIHRPRKNLITYKREDNVDGLCTYLNRYFKKLLRVVPDGDFIRIVFLNKKMSDVRLMLNDDFFVDQKNTNIKKC